MIAVLLIVLLISINNTKSSSSSSFNRTLSSIKYVHYPDVFFIGAMKSGTTSFHQLLVDASENMVLLINISSSS